MFFVDNAVPVEEAASADGRQVETPWSRTWLDQGVSVRTLADGRRFRIVKRAWTPEELERELDALGWFATVREHQRLFISGEAVPRSTTSAPAAPSSTGGDDPATGDPSTPA